MLNECNSFSVILRFGSKLGFIKSIPKPHSITMMLKPAKPFSKVVGISSLTLYFPLRYLITSSVIL